VTPTPSRPLTSVPGVDSLSDLSSESEHSSPETNTPGQCYGCTGNGNISSNCVKLSAVTQQQLL